MENRQAIQAKLRAIQQTLVPQTKDLNRAQKAAYVSMSEAERFKNEAIMGEKPKRRDLEGGKACEP
jgi:hypothetical protein